MLLPARLIDSWFTCFIGGGGCRRCEIKIEVTGGKEGRAIDVVGESWAGVCGTMGILFERWMITTLYKGRQSCWPYDKEVYGRSL